MNTTDTPGASLPIGDAARLLGVSVDTIRRWDREGIIASTRTPGGQRRYEAAEIARVKTERAA